MRKCLRKRGHFHPSILPKSYFLSHYPIETSGLKTFISRVTISAALTSQTLLLKLYSEGKHHNQFAVKAMFSEIKFPRPKTVTTDQLTRYTLEVSRENFL